MKTLYIHIGMPKTGTSSIQHFLLENRDVLQKKKYCFPVFPYEYPYVGDNRNGYFLIGKCVDEVGERDKRLERWRHKEAFKIINECFAKNDNVILSEETLWRWLHVKTKVTPFIKQQADENNYTVKIIIYLRRQDEFQISNWKQNVKHPASAMTMSFEERLNDVLEHQEYIFKYGSGLDELAEIFGAENIIARRFSPAFWVNNSLIDDFLSCVGLEHTGDFKELPKMSNASLSENNAYIKRIINENKDFSAKENAYFANLLRRLPSNSTEAYPCSMMSKEEAQAFVNRFADENNHVAEKYIGDGKPLFSDEYKDLPKWQADNPQMQKDMIMFMSAAVIDIKRQIRKKPTKQKKPKKRVVNKLSLWARIKYKLRSIFKRKTAN